MRSRGSATQWTPWRVAAQVAAALSRAGQAGALENARVAAVECSRAAVERADVLVYLDAAATGPAYAAAT